MRMLMAKLRRRRNRRTLLRLSRWCVRITRLQLSLLDRRSKAFKQKREARDNLKLEQRQSLLQSAEEEISLTNLKLPLNLQTEEEQEALEDLQLVASRMITLLSRTT